MNVFLAIHEYAGEAHISVFSTKEAAEKYRESIAREHWKSLTPLFDCPAEFDEAYYWEAVSDYEEWFSIEEHKVME